MVGGQAGDQAKFERDISDYINLAYKHYKPIGVAAPAQPAIKTAGNQAGVIFAANNPNFENEFVAAIGQQRFWNRT
ncbi:MAG: hypothetical protein RQM92_12320 [Candidatus Syntrophopropionicum ammoniitolerans]